MYFKYVNYSQKHMPQKKNNVASCHDVCSGEEMGEEVGEGRGQRGANQ